MELFDFQVITTSLPEFWRGLLMTLQLTGIALLCGFAAAVPLAVARVSKNRWISGPVAPTPTSSAARRCSCNCC